MSDSALYYVLRTIVDSKRLHDRSVVERIHAVTDDYANAIATANELRIATWRHDDGSIRVLADGEVIDCAERDPHLFRWLCGASVISVDSYALVIDDPVLAEIDRRIARDECVAADSKGQRRQDALARIAHSWRVRRSMTCD